MHSRWYQQANVLIDRPWSDLSQVIPFSPIEAVGCVIFLREIVQSDSTYREFAVRRVAVR